MEAEIGVVEVNVLAMIFFDEATIGAVFVVIPIVILAGVLIVVAVPLAIAMIAAIVAIGMAVSPDPILLLVARD